jgi:hypothetical protein
MKADRNFRVYLIDGVIVVAVLMVIGAAAFWLIDLTSGKSKGDSVPNEKIVEVLKQHSDALEEHKKAINDLRARVNGFVFIMERARTGLGDAAKDQQENIEGQTQSPE